MPPLGVVGKEKPGHFADVDGDKEQNQPLIINQTKSADRVNPSALFVTHWYFSAGYRLHAARMVSAR